MDNNELNLSEHKLTPNQISYIKISKTPVLKLAERYGVTAQTIAYHRKKVASQISVHHRTEKKVKVERKTNDFKFSLEEETFIKSLPVILKNAQGPVSFEVRS